MPAVTEAGADPVAAAIGALPPLREVIRGAGLDARRKLGQKFLLDLNLTGRIAREAGPLRGTVIEIGPGPGGLTRALLTAGAERVVAVEKDKRAVAALAPLADAARGRLEIVEGDALGMDVADLLAGRKGVVVANLPYNIATALLLKWLDRLEHLEAMTLMFQKEVAERITASPGSGSYGRLAVLCQWLCETAMLFDIPPSAFVPPPKVISSVVRLTPRARPLAAAEKPLLEETTRVLFGQRRKMLRSSVKRLAGKDGDPAGLLAAAGVDVDARPERLAVEDFCGIARALGAARARRG